MLRGVRVAGVLLALGLTAPSAVQADGIDDFNGSWTGQALQRQRGLDLDVPLWDTNIVGAHNSFNSSVYAGPLSYPDPNQVDSIFNQLRMGARSIELDVHWTPKQEGTFSFPDRLLLCHGTSGHFGCSTSDRYFAEGLDEIAAWLNTTDSENQVLVLHIEDHMDGEHGEAFNQVNARFGNRVYTSGGCGDIPGNLTKQDVLNLGRNVVIWSDSGCSGDGNWNAMVFTGLGGIDRIWEDSTTIGGIAGAGAPITDDDVSNGFANGTNIIDLDQLHQGDSRWSAAVWSWDVDEPNNFGGQEHGALQHGNGRWNDDHCETLHAFACEHASSGQWAVSSIVGAWGVGAFACGSLGADYQFSRPTHSQDNRALKQAKEAAGRSSVWLNHDDRSSEGNWSTTLTNDVFFSAGSLTLTAGQSVHGLTRKLKMESNCDLVLYSAQGGVTGGSIWTSGTASLGSNCRTDFQGDGNLVIYDGNGSALWHSSTSGAELRLQGDGNAVIYDGSGGALWQTFTNYASEVAIAAGQFSLAPGEILHSQNRKLQMRSDCNLVLYSFENGLTGGAVWQSETNGSGTSCSALFQGDGNFVVYDGLGQPLWASGTSGTSGGELRLQSDGNLVVYNGSNQPLWSANGNIPSEFLWNAGGFSFAPGDFAQSQNRKWVMQSDCNLVLYNVANALVGGALWHSDTHLAGVDCRADFQADGNLVIYDGVGQALWASGTSGTSGAQLRLQPDGNAVIYNGVGEPLWTSNTPGTFVSESYCGDLSCGGTETCSICPGDCGVCAPVCGDLACDEAETCSTCSIDCGECSGGEGYCGDFTCGAAETCSSCSADCGSCPPVCGDLTCDGAETCSACSTDCGSCGGEVAVPALSGRGLVLLGFALAGSLLLQALPGHFRHRNRDRPTSTPPALD
ncbi:MAG: hypothetical protein VX574_03720 [Myxococcota bacterium]|nr:hypothetical protein [Myxococcota bacterium]